MGVNEHSAVDELDEKILRVMLDNSRLSYRKIAKQVDVSVATIMNRVQRLEKQGIIKKYSAMLDYEKLGYDVAVIIELKISKGKLLQVEEKIAKSPNVQLVFDHTGPMDATVIAKFKNRKAMDVFLKKLQAYDFVERTETSLILNIMKEEQVRV